MFKDFLMNSCPHHAKKDSQPHGIASHLPQQIARDRELLYDTTDSVSVLQLIFNFVVFRHDVLQKHNISRSDVEFN